ncbi:unnamed protein product [Arabis nemorensis]|uniref:RNase H type-1 domain-containing protein n=1 Tax=Arabis nemorensis TaxID=586526 RepID=A0A565BTN2_9BRAS|nr:unnamed protein product [Arabis nemorensis]
MFSNRTFSESEVMTKLVEARSWQTAQVLKPQHRIFPPTQPLDTEFTLGTLCFVDTTWNSTTLNCGVGWALKAVSEKQFGEDTASFGNVPSALSAEAEAIKAALTQTKDQKFEELHVLLDSLTLVNILKTREAYNELYGVLFDIRDLAFDFRLISFKFTLCTTNCEADCLAKNALRSLEYFVS